jgi:hypothetical protein
MLAYAHIHRNAHTYTYMQRHAIETIKTYATISACIEKIPPMNTYIYRDII